ncbi:hypothetical protein DCAR_0103279 [Daucus carota subsp. sativus]|uniref:PB1 domain-containing protein n=1 Tax=Daucus carota subsp. sativus TaxID=79200 RepID=A0A166HVR5_DAUCS|nr:PREDICTED: uncharacterized protein LOC108204683 [Daucus carota subsp. sativus]WOG84099.1 hypothetical protein DCAR_0103279 [Daucus carota subsp. sativus]
MGKPIGKKKIAEGNVKNNKVSDRNSKLFDEDTAVFINLSQEYKEEGNILFQKHDYEGAILKYEKALNLLPKNHIDIAYLRSNIAGCFMQMGLAEFPRAINECNLALEVAPKYSKALLRRAKCYEGLNRLDLALRDVNYVLSMEPNNLLALEIMDKLKKTFEQKGLSIEDKEMVLPTEYVEPNVNRAWKDNRKKKGRQQTSKQQQNRTKEKEAKIKNKDVKVEDKKSEDIEKKMPEVKVVVDEKVSPMEDKMVTKPVKLVYGEDIRFTQLPVGCGIRLVREVVQDRFPYIKGVLIKYKDPEGDLITITTTDELRLAEASAGAIGSLRLYIVEVSPEKEPVYERMDDEAELENLNSKPSNGEGNGGVDKVKEIENAPSCVEDWIVQFARLFKNHVGFDSDSYLDLHELGMKLYSEAMEETVTNEDAQGLFETAADKFQEMSALSLFNCGNVHMNMARKRVFFGEDSSTDTIMTQVKISYEWAKKEYKMAGMKYEEALQIQSDFYEALLALGLQQFEQAKLCWYYAIGNKIDLKTWPSIEVLDLYNKAEDSLDRGMQMWEELEEQRLNGLYKADKYKIDLNKMGLNGLVKELSADEAAEQAGNMGSQIYLLWGTVLYERSIVEFKLDLPTWEECLEVAVEKFELSGASQTDIAVMIKNHISNGEALEGFGFKIDEIIQAWNEMYDAKRWQTGVPSFRLEPMFRRRVPKLHSVLEHVSLFCTTDDSTK